MSLLEFKFIHHRLVFLALGRGGRGGVSSNNGGSCIARGLKAGEFGSLSPSLATSSAEGRWRKRRTNLSHFETTVGKPVSSSKVSSML